MKSARVFSGGKCLKGQERENISEMTFELSEEPNLRNGWGRKFQGKAQR